METQSLKALANKLYFYHEEYFFGKIEGKDYSKIEDDIRSQVLTNYGEPGVNEFNNMFDKLVQEGDRRKFSGR